MTGFVMRYLRYLRGESMLAAVTFSALCLMAAQSLAAALPEFTELVKENAPAVVNISTTQKQQPRARLPKGFEMPDVPRDSPFYEFFKRFFGEGEIEEFDAQSLGSGFIISSDGYVVTNNHVVKEADEIIVRFSDRREFEAEIVGSDERSDLALLKIEASGLPVVKLGMGYDVQVGEWVLAIGSPFGFDHTVTAGIVSAKGRSLPRENYVPFIQTDVAINPGNSGGPLFNLDGEVIGVNSQIFSRTGGFMGLSFAIPIDVAKEVTDQLRTQGHVSRGWLGVLIQDVTRELAESFGMEKPQGALVAKVLPGSPAERAGLEVGDVVVNFDGTTIVNSSDLPPLVGRTTVDSRVPVEVLRSGKSINLDVVVDELPDEEELRLAAGGRAETAADNPLGLAVADLTTEQREQYELSENGVVVESVGEGPAQRAGIRKGDLILRLDNLDVKDRDHFEQLSSELPPGKAISVLVQRGGNPLFLALKTDSD
jgi:serine protease Do